MRIDGEPAVIVGVPIVAAGAQYFQIAPMTDIDNTLSRLASSLAVAGAVATALAIGVGFITSGKVLRPLRRIADVAGDIERGDLESRLDAEGDRDLSPLVESFNAMLDDLQARIGREARFASDVAHEVRGPLASLGAAVDVVNRRRDELPDRAVFAVDALQEQVRAFNALVLDLLEISRFDAGAARLQREPVDLTHVVRRALDEAGLADVPVRSTLADATVDVDRRRLHQMLTNLLENARHYAGGPTAITLDAADGVVRIAVEDRGPGVPIAERDAIFDRFAAWTGIRTSRRAPGQRSRPGAGGRTCPAPWRTRVRRGRRRGRSPLRHRDPGRHSMSRGARAGIAVIAALAMLAACGVGTESTAVPVDDDDVPFGLLTTPTTAPPPDITTSDSATAITLCFHLGPDVTTVSRAAPEQGVTAALDAFLDGPSSDEQDAGISSAVFDPDVVLAGRVNAGTATVELSPAFADAGTTIQLDVIIELVCTLTAQPGVGQVAFELRGERIEVPRGDGSLSAEPLSRDDFPELSR